MRPKRIIVPNDPLWLPVSLCNRKRDIKYKFSFGPSERKAYGKQKTDYGQYRNSPIGFGENVLGESYTDDVKKLMKSVLENPITVAKSANGTGKTHVAARIAVWFYKSLSGAQVYTGAAPPEANLKKLLWGEIGSLVERHPKLFEDDDITTLHIQRSSQEFLTGVTIPVSGSGAVQEAKFSGKHAPYLLFILDEADAIPDAVFRGIESCMSGGHARLLCLFNPRAEQGEVYRMIRDRRANVVELSAWNHPNVVTGAEIIPGAVNRKTTVRRVNQWTRPLAAEEKPDSECYELPDYLEGATACSTGGIEYPPLIAGWYKVMDPAFSYMVMGKYPAQSSKRLISTEWIDRARSRWDAYVLEHGECPPKYTTAIMGLDVAEYGIDANSACFRYGGYVAPFVRWSGIDPLATADRASVEYKARKTSRANVDATGVGSGVAPQMQRLGCSAVAVKVASSPTEKTELGEFKILRDQLIFAIRKWLRTDPGAMLPPNERLVEELRIVTYEIVNGKIRVMKKETMKELLKRSPDDLDSLSLTFAPGGFFDDCDTT